MATNRTVELRSWQSPFDQSCTMTTDQRIELTRASFGPGATLRTGLPFKQLVLPNAAPRVELLVFTPPPEGTKELTLALEAERVGETGKIYLSIPASAWKK
jgi:hypothetical protein